MPSGHDEDRPRLVYERLRDAWLQLWVRAQHEYCQAMAIRQPSIADDHLGDDLIGSIGDVFESKIQWALKAMWKLPRRAHRDEVLAYQGLSGGVYPFRDSRSFNHTELTCRFGGETITLSVSDNLVDYPDLWAGEVEIGSEGEILPSVLHKSPMRYLWQSCLEPGDFLLEHIPTPLEPEAGLHCERMVQASLQPDFGLEQLRTFGREDVDVQVERIARQLARSARSSGMVVKTDTSGVWRHAGLRCDWGLASPQYVQVDSKLTGRPTIRIFGVNRPYADDEPWYALRAWTANGTPIGDPTKPDSGVTIVDGVSECWSAVRGLLKP